MVLYSSDTTNNNSNSNNDGTHNWMGHKQQGSAYYQREHYEEALASFRAALNPDFTVPCPRAEKQIILSNIVACRLKIGGLPQAEAAVEDAKQCIALNPQWSKGHVRLATAYIALGNHSNDACNSLQRALSLDPGNSSARQLLMRELRRDHIQTRTERENSTNSAETAGAGGAVPSAPYQEEDNNNFRHATPTAPPEEEEDNYNTTEPIYNDVPPSSSSYQNPFSSSRSSRQDANTDDLDESLSWTDWIKFYWDSTKAWYHAQPEDIKTILKVVIGILILYIAFGGRFGFEQYGSNHMNRGNYEYGNAYDRYRTKGSSTTYDTYNSQRQPTDYSSRQQQQQYKSNYDSYESRYNNRQTNNDYYGQGRSSNRGGGTSFHMPNLFDGSFTSILVLSGFAYFCHQNGINPFQALWMLNLFTGNRRHHNMRHMGMAGMGYGMLRNAGYMGGRRRRGG